MKKTLLTALIALPLSQGVMADYQMEGQGSFADSDGGSVIGLKGTYFLESVSTGNGPEAEAAFLDKASSVSAEWRDNSDADATNLDFEGRYVHEGEYIGELGFDKDDDTTTISFGGGIYLEDNTTIIGRYTNNSDADTSAFGVEYKKIGDFFDISNTLGVTAGVSRVSFGDFSSFVFDAEVDYYLDDSFSVGGTFGIAFGDLDSTSFGGQAQYFFSESASIKGSLTIESPDVGDSDTVLAVAGIFRF